MEGNRRKGAELRVEIESHPERWRGKVLVCTCRPAFVPAGGDARPCHGDVIAGFANALPKPECAETLVTKAAA